MFFKVLQRYFGKLPSWMGGLRDSRIEAMCLYPLKYMVFVGILLFVLRLRKRRQLLRMRQKMLIKNLNKFLNVSLPSFTHHDNLEYFCKKFDPRNLEVLRHLMIQTLIRKKVLNKYRIFKKYIMIAIDGTGNLKFKKPHPKCLVKRLQNGRLLYYKPVLEAKIITETGLALSIGTEFIENEKKSFKEMTDEERQDCEIMAAYRLLERIKKMYPQLLICILADGLYANRNIIKLCEKFGWRYLITLKKRLKSVNTEFESLQKLQPENKKYYEDDKVEQNYRWANQIDYKNYSVNVAECHEIQKKVKDPKKREKTFCYITNFTVSDQSVIYLVQNGRFRWKIENEGFNVQKNKGYNLEHQFSSHDRAAKNYYLFMQIAHIINQLVEKSNLLHRELNSFFTLENLSERLAWELTLLEIDFREIFRFSNCYIILRPG